jgi:hypothetical protein
MVMGLALDPAYRGIEYRKIGHGRNSECRVRCVDRRRVPIETPRYIQNILIAYPNP